MSDQALSGQRVLIRVDFNVPISHGEVMSDARIQASIPTCRLALAAGACGILMSHLGRPVEGTVDATASLAPVAGRLAELLGCPVRLVSNWLDGVEVRPGEVGLCENVRFYSGEKANENDLARRMAALCDVFVMDAYGTAHRAQSSPHGVARFAPIACAGPLLGGELDALTKALEDPKRPMCAIVGGSKVSTKLLVLESLYEVVDQLIPGGGIANTFIAAAGHEVGQSLYEPALLDTARQLLDRAAAAGKEIPIPTDVIVAKEVSSTAKARVTRVDSVASDELILDIGPESALRLAKQLSCAGTILWNGPVGVVELDPFAAGTETIGRAIADSCAFSIAGGGDTLAAVDKYNLGEKISYVSTGGGAFLEFLEGKTLPAVEILESRANG